MKSFVAELEWRGLLLQSTDPTLDEKLRAESFTLYAGFDPTATSLHVGSLLPIMALRRAQLAGHRPIAVVGGATGMVGDPSGKTEERKLLGPEELAKNCTGIQRQLEHFLDFSDGAALLVSNADWFAEIRYIDFLRDVGKLFSVNAMMKKDSVRSRLEREEVGITYTEFSYMLIQAYDYLHLFDAYGCRLQIGGSDQWGNITEGIDLIRRLRQKEAYGLTMPLVTTAAGQKFGKSEKGAVWLDPELTSPYELYQFFMKTDDRDVGKFLRYYTLLDEKRIVELEETLRVAPEKREAHRVLAAEVTALVHGADEARGAEERTQLLFEKGSAATGGTAAAELEVNSTEARGSLDGGGVPLVDLLVRTMFPSKGAARRAIEGGGIYINEEKVTDVNRAVNAADLRGDGILSLRHGKRNYHIVKFA